MQQVETDTENNTGSDSVAQAQPLEGSDAATGNGVNAEASDPPEPPQEPVSGLVQPPFIPEPLQEPVSGLVQPPFIPEPLQELVSGLMQPPFIPEPPQDPVGGLVQPPFIPPPCRPGRKTSQFSYMNMNNVMKAMWEHPCAWSLQPIDSDLLNLPHCSGIREPMSLGMIKMRLENNYYWCSRECLQDFHTMFTNLYSAYKIRGINKYDESYIDISESVILMEIFFLIKMNTLMLEKEEVEGYPNHDNDEPDRGPAPGSDGVHWPSPGSQACRSV